MVLISHTWHIAQTINERLALTFSRSVAVLVSFALALALVGCAESQWASVSLDCGAGVGLPMLGVETEAHCKLDLNKPGGSDAKAPDPAVAAGRDALLELHDWPVKDP